METTPIRRIMVLGGYGRYGQHITHTLANVAGLKLIAAGRKPPRERSNHHSNIRFLKVDANDPVSLKSALADVFLLINATGLFESNNRYEVARACAESGTHYIDLADNRDYINNFVGLAELAEQQQVLLITAAGASPSLSALLVDTIKHEYDEIHAIRVYRSAGNLNPGGPASLKTLLSQIGQQIRVRQQGQWHNITAWSNSQNIRFPEPVGRRRCFCVNAPELDALVDRFNAQTVIFRTGFELGLFNLGLSMLARSRRKTGINAPEKLARWLLRLGRMARNFGSDNDVLGVIVRGIKDGREIEHSAYLVARAGAGVAIPCAPALALAHKLLNEGVPGAGVARTQDILVFDDVRAELSRHNVVLVRV